LTAEIASPLRVFAALELPLEVRNRLEALISALEAALPRSAVRWVNARGMHLTVKFYGDVAPERLPDVQRALQQVAAGASSLNLELRGLGVFPNPVHPRVIWAGAAGDLESLRALQQQVEAASIPLGFKPEARGFTPHLTLGRVKGHLSSVDRQALAEALTRQRAPAEQLGAFTAETLNLMRSDLRPTGAVYTQLFAVPLGGRRAEDLSGF